MNLVSEVWKVIPGYTRYEVSQYGRIRSNRTGKPYIIKLYAEKYKNITYMRVYMEDDHGVGRKVRVHLLVLEAFAGPRPSSDHVGCHIDGNSVNNWLLNLKWATKKENEADKRLHGRIVFGVRIRSAKLNPAKVRIIRAAYAKGWDRKVINKLAAKYGVDRRTIINAATGKHWKEVA